MVRPIDIQDILARAVGCNDEELDRLLERECGSDAALRVEVESLLRSLAGAGRFLASPTAGSSGIQNHSPVATAATIAGSSSEEIGVSVGPYKLLERLGEGGFGTVYLAEQEQPVRRRIALKIIKPGMDSRQVIARFEA